MKNQKEKEKEIWCMTTEKNRVLLKEIAPALRSRDYKDAPIIIVLPKQNTLSAG